jgi:hypothetical protein
MISIALIALLTFMKCANNTSFESRDLDEILVEGTSLYRVIAETTGRNKTDAPFSLEPIKITLMQVK